MSEQYPDDWDNIRRRVLARDLYTCLECGSNNEILHVHHITPISEGGSHDPDNLRTLCSDCHAAVHDENACEICGMFADHFLIESKGDTAGPFHLCSSCYDGLNSNSGCAICESSTSGKYFLYELGGELDDDSVFDSDLCRECRNHTSFRKQYGRIDSDLFKAWSDGRGHGGDRAEVTNE